VLLTQTLLAMSSISRDGRAWVAFSACLLAASNGFTSFLTPDTPGRFIITPDFIYLIILISSQGGQGSQGYF
jgi:hypothetical protein